MLILTILASFFVLVAFMEKIFEVVTMAFSLTPENKLIFILTLYPGFSLNVTVIFISFS